MWQLLKIPAIYQNQHGVSVPTVIEGSEARSGFSMKKSRQAENLSNHIFDQKGIVCDSVHVHMSNLLFTSVSTASRLLELKAGLNLPSFSHAAILYQTAGASMAVHNW